MKHSLALMFKCKNYRVLLTIIKTNNVVML